MRITDVEGQGKELLVDGFWKSNSYCFHRFIIKFCVVHFPPLSHRKKLECPVSNRIPHVRFCGTSIKMIRVAAKFVSALVTNVGSLGWFSVGKNVGRPVRRNDSTSPATSKSKYGVGSFWNSVPRPAIIWSLLDNLIPKSFSSRFGVFLGCNSSDFTHVCFMVKHVLSRTYTPRGVN